MNYTSLVDLYVSQYLHFLNQRSRPVVGQRAFQFRRETLLDCREYDRQIQFLQVEVARLVARLLSIRLLLRRLYCFQGFTY